MQSISRNKIVFSLFALVVGAFGLTACQDTNINSNVNQTNISNVPLVGNVNVIVANANSANANSPAGENTGIEAREPETYQATVTLKLQTGSDSGSTQQTPTFPPIAVQFARSGNNKRMEFAMPSGEKVIYLDRSGQQLLISPQRKQYAELNKESLGFDAPQMLMPGQIISRVKAIKGIERVGEEKFGNRDAVKYHYNSITETKSQAGNVETEAVIFVDKETGLPLRSETFAESQSGAVGGMKSLRFVTEMSNLQMTADPTLFAEPTEYKKVPAQEIRGQVDAIFSVVVTLLGQAMKTQSAAAPMPSPSTPTPTMTP